MPMTFARLPNLSDAELIFNEVETKTILAFFWPDRPAAISNLAISTEVRRLAQQLLIVAIDASYAMGYLALLADTIVTRRPGAAMSTIIKRLARNYVRHWWKHATREKLQDAAIYNSVRNDIALKFRSVLEMSIEGAALKINTHPFYLAVNHSAGGVWKC